MMAAIRDERCSTVEAKGALAAQEGQCARFRASALLFISRFSVDMYVSATFSLLLFSDT
jgi:hypothetical protein